MINYDLITDEVRRLRREYEGPFVLRGHPDDYCNHKNTVMVRFDRISYTSPLITHDACAEFIRQFRTVHRIDPEYYDMIDNLLHIR